MLCFSTVWVSEPTNSPFLPSLLELGFCHFITPSFLGGLLWKMMLGRHFLECGQSTFVQIALALVVSAWVGSGDLATFQSQANQMAGRP